MRASPFFCVRTLCCFVHFQGFYMAEFFNLRRRSTADICVRKISCVESSQCPVKTKFSCYVFFFSVSFFCSHSLSLSAAARWSRDAAVYATSPPPSVVVSLDVPALFSLLISTLRSQHKNPFQCNRVQLFFLFACSSVFNLCNRFILCAGLFALFLAYTLKAAESFHACVAALQWAEYALQPDVATKCMGALSCNFAMFFFYFAGEKLLWNAENENSIHSCMMQA